MPANTEVAPLSSVDEINKDWIAKVLTIKMNADISVESLETKIPETKAGFLSDICFVKAVFTVENSTMEVPLVVKVMPVNEQIVAFMKMGNLGQREVSFYLRAGSEEFLKFCQASGLDRPVPKVYWSGLKENDLTLVLEDLNFKGYRMCLLPEGNSLQQVKSTLEAIAVIHAYGFSTISKHGKEYFHVPFDSSYLDDIVCMGLQRLIDIYAGTPQAETFTALMSLNKQMISTSDNYRLFETLVHGDLWAGNVMFTADDKTASIFDWQFASIGNPLCDVTSMLLMSAEPTVYEKHLVEVLECYWKSFTNALAKNDTKAPVTYDYLLKNFDKLWVHGFMFFTASLPDMMDNNKITKDRICKVISYIEKIGVISSFLKLHKE